MASTKRKSVDSESTIEEENEETGALGRGKRAKKVARKLIASEEDRLKEAARLEKKLAKLRSATVIQEPKQVSLKAGSSVKQTGGIQASSNKTGKKALSITAVENGRYVCLFFIFVMHPLTSPYFIIFNYIFVAEKEKEVSSSVESNQPSISNKKTAAPKSPENPPTPAVEPSK
jgi:hypothetical protein